MSAKIEALVINLATADRRRAFQVAQLDRLGLRYDFIDAPPPDRIDPAELERRMNGWARPLRPSEVSCLLSHRAAWARAAGHAVPSLVLEDDAVLSDDLPDLLERLKPLADVDYVNIETLDVPKLLANRRQDIPGTRYGLSELVRHRGGAGAYVLWPEGAKALLRYTEEASPLADSAMMLAPGLKRFQLEPAASTQAFLFAENPFVYQELVSSTEAGSRPPYPGVRAFLTGKGRRVRVSLAILARKLRFLGQSGERSVPFDKGRIVMSRNSICEL